MRLSLSALADIPSGMRPSYDVEGLGVGIVHLGLGAFHRAHQGAFTDAAIAAGGGDWGILGVSMRKPDVARSVSHQQGLYTVEISDRLRDYKVVGALRETATLALEPQRVVSAIASPAVHLVTLTITEKGYCLAGDQLDLRHPDIARDFAAPAAPASAIGALAAGLSARRAAGAGPITVMSCDNLVDNGPRLKAAVYAFAERSDPALSTWLDGNAAFPETMVDSIVPATTDESRRRVEAAIGFEDQASVQREPFAQWVIENRFAGPRPPWERVGVELVADVRPYRRIKLHVLNATHSALAYLGLERGHVFVDKAIADPDLLRFLDAMVAEEIAPALPAMDVGAYWRTTKERFQNPAIDYRLEQIAQDGAFKLAERVYPLLVSNARAGLPVARLAAVVRAWLQSTGGEAAARLADPRLFPEPFRADTRLRSAVLGEAI